MSTQLRKGSTELSSDRSNTLQQLLFYTNKDMKNCLFIHAGTSIPIITQKLTNNHSQIISNRPLFRYLSYSGNNQRSKLDIKSSSIPVKGTELFYCLVGRFLLTNKITRPDIHTC